jgi:hypothetical protein
MTASRFAAAAVICLLLASSAFAGPEGSAPSLADPSLLGLTPADDLFATADLTTLLDPSSNGTQHYGPYPSTSPDSGTCGNDWAEDTFDRHFTVHREQGGAFTVIEQFKNGEFTTMSAPPPFAPLSPGACQNSLTPQGTVNPGVTGELHGYFVIPLPVGTMQTSTSPYCDAAGMTNTNCDTTTFVDTHFTPCYAAGLCSVTTFFFHYSAGDQMLIEHEWKNASADRGGNHGDIRSMNLP